MAEPILYKVEAPDGVQVPWTGIKPNIQNPDFDLGDFDRAVRFVDTLECLRTDKGDPAGIVQHPILIWKEANLNTPFFKEVCHRRLLIPKIQFFFFHSLKGDSQLINFLTIELEKALVLTSKVELHDTSEAHNPDKGVISQKKSKPYIEEVVFSAQLIRWKYKRDSDPCAAEHGSEFNVP
jgi:type VI protein secretion system component Hcp